jgi:hypothetical protein
VSTKYGAHQRIGIDRVAGRELAQPSGHKAVVSSRIGRTGAKRMTVDHA